MPPDPSRDHAPSDIEVMAELVEASKGYVGCDDVSKITEGDWSPCGACWGCRLAAAVQKAEKRIEEVGVAEERNLDGPAGVQVGDRILWCDRVVEVLAIEPGVKKILTPRQRTGRHFTVREDDGTKHRLHYFDDEMISRG